MTSATSEAKDFLISQIINEAERKGESLSDLERRMLEFSEVEKAPADYLELNAEFERECSEIEYEDKISELARSRIEHLRATQSPDLDEWNNAISLSSEDDHYLMVMINMASRSRSPHGEPPPAASHPTNDRLKLLLTAAAIVLFLLAGVLLLSKITNN